jgi:Skp family chaperone for outer membrane proteins
MRKLTGLLAAVLLSATLGASAGEIAVVRIQEVLKNSDYAKQMETKIRSDFKTDEQEIEDLQKVIRNNTEKMQSDPMLSPDSYTYKDTVLQIERVRLKLNDKMQNFNKNTRLQMATFWRNVYADFRAAVDRVAASGKYDLIITAPDIELSPETANSESPEAMMMEILRRNVQYINPRVDVTQQVIDTMNAINRARVAAPR